VDAPKGPDFTQLAARQIARLREAKARRDAARVAESLAAVENAAASASGPLMEPIIGAVRARATLGEISGALERAFGRYDRDG